ncbi:MAG: hypothetical protein ACE5PT_07540 [Gemmatimonadales bacterium]
MAARRASKPLDTPGPAVEAWAVRSLMLAALASGAAVAPAAPLAAQAPQAADLWRVAAATLVVPAALEQGPTGGFWNPAARQDGVLAAGLEVVETSDIIGLSGLIAGASYAAGPGRLGIELARVEVRDLVRTAGSPSSQIGSIPVYEQFVGINAQLSRGRATVAASARLHDSRFDVIDEQGVTVDIGVALAPLSRLRLAGATHFMPFDLKDRATTDYYGAAEYAVLGAIPMLGTSAELLARYGVTRRSSGDVEHSVGLGGALNDRLSIEGALMGESAYGQRSWRPALGITFRVGRYTIGLARSEGLNDLGAAYRVGLDVELTR